MKDFEQQQQEGRDRKLRVMLLYALTRPIGGFILAVSIIISVFTSFWWFFLIGLAFYGYFVWASLNDAEANRQVVNQSFYPEQSNDLGRLRDDYRGIMQQALAKRKEIEQEVANTGSTPIRSSLTSAIEGVDELTDHVYTICYKAQSLEGYLRNINPAALDNEAAMIRARVAQSNDEFQRQQYEEALKAKENQLTNTQEMQQALLRWQAQLTNALTALDAIHSNVLKIKSAEVRSLSSATDQVSYDIKQQVDTLRNIANAYDSVLSGKIS